MAREAHSALRSELSGSTRYGSSFNQKVLSTFTLQKEEICRNKLNLNGIVVRIQTFRFWVSLWTWSPGSILKRSDSSRVCTCARVPTSRLDSPAARRSAGRRRRTVRACRVTEGVLGVRRCPARVPVTLRAVLGSCVPPLTDSCRSRLPAHGQHAQQLALMSKKPSSLGS